MRNNPFLFCLFLFAYGVFGADGVKSVSVMVGDSVTLNTDETEIQEALELDWKIQGENKSIAEIDKEINTFSVPGNNDEPFRGRLKLDDQTGSLTITNLKTTDSRVYELQIKTSKGIKPKIFNVTVRDVVESVSVMEGDSVTLHTDVTEVQGDDQIQWKFEDQDLNGAVDARWRNIHLNDRTRELTIRNIRNDQSGHYKVKIITSSMILHRIFRISFRGVFSDEKDGVKTVSVKKGDLVHLHTHVTEIEKDDPIEWTFGPENISIAKTDGKSKFISYNYDDERFKNKLHLNTDTADLTIKNSNSEHSGLYQLKIGNTTYTIQKRFSVTVSAHVLSVLEVALICVIGLLLAAAIAAGFICKKCRHPRSRNSPVLGELTNANSESNAYETQTPLRNMEDP